MTMSQVSKIPRSILGNASLCYWGPGIPEIYKKYYFYTNITVKITPGTQSHQKLNMGTGEIIVTNYAELISFDV